MYCHPYLGVELAGYLRWNNHIFKLTAKSNCLLGFIRRNLFKCSERNKQTAYVALVRPNLEYTSAAWDPYTHNHIKEIEKVQRRATRFAKGDNNRESSVTLMIQDLKWDSLERRMEVSRLTLFYQAIHQETAIPFPNHLVHPINKK